MRKAFVVLGVWSLCLGCGGGVKGIQDTGNKLGNDVADSSVTKDVSDAGTNVGNDVADSSVTKDVSDAGTNVGNDVAPKKDAGAPPAATTEKPPAKKPPAKKPPAKK